VVAPTSRLEAKSNVLPEDSPSCGMEDKDV